MNNSTKLVEQFQGYPLVLKKVAVEFFFIETKK